MSMPKTVHTLESLMAKTVEEGECHLWTGYHGNKTPMVYHAGELVPVRRLVLELSGVKVFGEYIGCNCGNKSCIALSHVAQRNQLQHTQKMAGAANTGAVKTLRISKITATRRRNFAKLTIEKAREIRASEEEAKTVADREGVSKSLIHRIRAGKQWRDTASPFYGLGA